MSYNSGASDSGPDAHCSNKDYNFFYDGLSEGKLLIQKCDSCGELRTPPGPMCPKCNSLKWTAVPAKGTGKVYSYTIHHYPPLPNYETPHPVAVVEMAEGVRFLGAVFDIPVDKVAIGLPVKAVFSKMGKLPMFHFVPA